MPNPNDTLKERLARCRQIKVSVIGRKSGQTISTPISICFVLKVAIFCSPTSPTWDQPRSKRGCSSVAVLAS
jgi:hypothetical protein